MALVPKNLYGIGISPLSISNKRDGLAEELVANKTAGLFGILTESGGQVISAEHIGRCKTHLENFINKCTMENTIGKIYKINLNDELVRVITGSINLFDNEVLIDCGKVNPFAFRFDIDFDVYAKETDSHVSLDDLKVKIEFSLKKDIYIKNYFIEEKLIDLNKLAYHIDYDSIPMSAEFIDETEVDDDTTNDENNTNSNTTYGFKINTLEIIVPEDFDPNKHNIVIHEVLLALV